MILTEIFIPFTIPSGQGQTDTHNFFFQFLNKLSKISEMFMRLQEEVRLIEPNKPLIVQLKTLYIITFVTF